MKRFLIFLLLLSQFARGQVNLGLGLQAYYPFSGNANDASGNNNNPVFNNATLTADRLGNPNSAYHFNGTSSYMQIPNSATINTSNQISLCAWVRPMGYYAGTCHGNSILMKGDVDGLAGNYLLRFDDNFYTNGANCANPVPDIAHENFYGWGTNAGFPGYVPYIQTNQWYSVIFTYDGTTAKLYVNCELKITTTVPGLNFTNAYDLFFGKLNSPAYPYWFNGDLDEIRIYNRVLTLDEVKVLGGCPLNATPISGIINNYTPVLALNPCDNKLTVTDATAFNTGDTVLLMQMKGAVIDSSNTAGFGTITDYKNSGNYEFNYVKSKAGNIIELKNVLTRQYDIPAGKVQLIRVPYYFSANITSTLTCLPWDGSKGGVLAVNIRDTLELNADINTSGRGYLKGIMHNSNFNAYTCGITDYYWPDNTVDAAGKGEGVGYLSSNRNSGKGAAANGGGGGMNTNSGGGGGSNGNRGGRGGYEWNNCPNYLNSLNWGIPGNSLVYNTASNKIFMGGGGGAGHCNNQYDDPTFNADYNGGAGGAIVMINANTILNSNHKIISKGDSAYQPPYSPTYVTHDGMGAGGAGGTVLLNCNSYFSNLNVDVSGGKGADLVANVAVPGYVGPGGGGGGGVVWVNQGSLPANLSVTNNGGSNGVIVQAGNIPYGAAPGLAGINVFSLTIPVAAVPFKKNIDSVRIKDSLTNCFSFDFKGLGYTNTNPINSWQWFFGDGGSANTQNCSHTYLNGGTYTVKLIVTDINGCTDSISTAVTTSAFVADAGNDTALCSSGMISVTLHAAPAATYSWTPAIYLNNPTIQNPVATISSTTRFFLAASNGIGCTAIDSMTVTINPNPTVKTLNDTAVCKNAVLILTTTAGLAGYHWSPGIYLSDSTISNPRFIDTVSRTLYVVGTTAAGCSAKDTINITVKPLPIVKTINDTTICSNQTLTLFTSGAQTYSWLPVNNLSNPNIANPVFSGSAGQVYTVTGTGLNGCTAKDTVAIAVNIPNAIIAPPDKSMCANATVQLDGFNGTSVNYLWTPAAYLNNNSIIDPIAFPPVTTPFTVLITDPACQYSRSFTVLVTVSPVPVVNARSSNDIDCALRASNLSASGGDLYTWTPSTGLSSTSIPNPVATPPGTQKYYVLVTNSGGCSNIDSVTVQVNTLASLARYMPGAFTPNGDGLNDCYGLKTWMHINQLQFFIYNRWGELVFYSTNPASCWDGNYKGKKADAGGYVYYIKASTACGDVEHKGSFLLIR